MQGPGVDTPDEQQGADDYEPPRIEVLGTLAELTQGGTIGITDGNGISGFEGSTG